MKSVSASLVIFLFFAAIPIPLFADALADGGSKLKVEPAVPLKVHAFPLGDVRLLDGPFKHAMELDKQYLLSLDPDRLLHNFRVNAGLPSSAEPLGGWEEPKCELRGHFVGHYLSACALMYATTGDENIKAKRRRGRGRIGRVPGKNRHGLSERLSRRILRPPGIAQQGLGPLLYLA